MSWFKRTHEFEVNAVTLRHGLRRADCVSHVGNNLLGWRLSRPSLIERIESGLEAYYAVHPVTGVYSYLAVCRGERHWPFIRTRTNGHWSDELLTLSPCREDCRQLA